MAELDRDMEERICKAWHSLLQIAVEAKKNFRNCSAESMRFYAQPNHNFMFGNAAGFAVTVNKVYELVSIFGPHLFAQNPVRRASARTFGDPALAKILDLLLNYTPGEFAYKANSEQAITDGLISGRGAMFTEIDERTGLPISTQEHSANILVDPSEEKWYDGYYLMRVRRDVPVWKIAAKFGADKAERVKEGGADKTNELLGFSRRYKRAEFDANVKDHDIEKTYDAPRVTYVEIYSKMGIGLRGVTTHERGKEPHVTGKDSSDNVYLAYEPTQKVLLALDKWPIPFWADHGPHSWPVSFFDPGENRDRTWPISIITPALGEQRAINYLATYMLSQAKITSRNVWVASSSLPGQVETALKSSDVNVVAKTDQENPDDIGKYLQRIEFPDLSDQFVETLRYYEDLFEKRTGLYEIMYGQSRKQYRSATEAGLKGEHSRVRIDGIVERVEDWQTQIARKEAIAARWAVEPEHIAPIVGRELAMQWPQYQQGDLRRIMQEYEYTVVAGSMQKRTPKRRAEIAAERLERFGELWLNTRNLQALNEAIMEWEAANGNPSPERFAIQALPPPPAQEQQEKTPAEVIAIQGGQPVFGTPGAAMAPTQAGTTPQEAVTP